MTMTCRSYEMITLTLQAQVSYNNPFIENDVFCEFHSPSGKVHKVRGFYNGDNCWLVRFTPCEEGVWSYKVCPVYEDPGLEASGQLPVSANSPGEKGFVRANAGKGWGLEFDSGDEVLLLGDTMYNLFGAAHCGVDISEVLGHRKAQGFNLVRVRVPVSPYHPGVVENVWQNRSTWLWGGSPQMPDYTAFNLEYFKSVDRVMEIVQDMGMGLEVILEAWLMETPFNDRGRFLPEHEELYISYVISRYSAYTCVYMWCVANEYNLYTKWAEDCIADKYALRLAKLIKEEDGHHHPVAIHVTAAEHMKKSFKTRFKPYEVCDVLLMQYWGDISTQKARDLALGIEDELERSVIGSGKVNVMAEYGYEICPDLNDSPASHDGLLANHTRRGAWRSLFMGVHLISGFENTWGAHLTREKDPAGAAQFIHIKKFFTELLNFSELKPSSELLADLPGMSWEKGSRPLCMANSDSSVITAYLPTAGSIPINIKPGAEFSSFWFDPESGAVINGVGYEKLQECVVFNSPGGGDGAGNGKDWVLVIKNGLC